MELPSRTAVRRRLGRVAAVRDARDRWRATRRGVLDTVGVRFSLSDTNAIALTFDDGPDPRFTPELLDLLAAHGARATFFLTGTGALRHPALVRRIDAAGHQLGSHSMHHPFVRDQSYGTILREYRDGRAALEVTVGRPCRLFRPPGSDVGWRSLLAMRRVGLEPWLWTVDPEDWVPGRTADEVWRVLANARGGDVVVMHDGMELPKDERARDRSATLEAVERLLRTSGLTFTSLPA